MSKIFQSDLVSAGHDLHANRASDLIVVYAEFAITEALAVNHAVEMFVLPPNHVICDGFIDVDDLDTDGSPAIVLRAGLLAGTPRDTTFANRTSSSAIGAELLTGKTTGQAGGLVRFDVAGFNRLAPSASPRGVGIQVSTAPATSAAVGVKLRMQAFIRHALLGR